MKNMQTDDFEAGENVTDQVSRGKSSGIVVSVRLSQEDSDRLIDLADETGKTVSQVARQAIRTYMLQRGDRPNFVPEITGSVPHLSIVTVAPLGPRTSNEGPREVGEKTPPVQTGYPVGIS